MNSEYYSGELDHWAHAHHTISTEAVVNTMNEILNVNASLNVYMFHGGTSFGFNSGTSF